MTELDVLHDALGDLVRDQPPAPDRVHAVRRRVRRRAQVRGAASVLAVAVAVTGVAVLAPGRSSAPSAPAHRPPAPSPFLDWEPRLVGTGSETGVLAAQNAWNVEHVGVLLPDLHELYSGTPAGSTDQWVAFEATRVDPPAPSLAGPRLVIARTTGYPDFQATVVADVPAPDPATTEAVSVVEQFVEHGDYVGQPGSTDRTTAFVLPAPDRHLQLRALHGPRPQTRPVDEPAVLTLSGVAAPLELSADGSTWRRAGVPVSETFPVRTDDGSGHVTTTDQVPAVRLAPPRPPAGFVAANAMSGGTGSSATFPLGRATLRLLARCTSYGTEPMRVAVQASGAGGTYDVPCDGGVHPVGDQLPVQGGTVTLAPQSDEQVDELVIGAYVPAADAARLGVRAR